MSRGSTGADLGTPWAKGSATPVRAYLETESGSARVLAAAIVIAFVWANAGESYEATWAVELEGRLGTATVTHDLRTWVNSGLMTMFFLVVGLEARREIDLGDLRDRSRLLLPAAVGLVGMVVPVGLYLAVNVHSGAAGGWAVAMSTDTALALGLLAMVGRDVPDRTRIFLLTIFVFDDAAALLVIAVKYSDGVRLEYVGLAGLLYGLMLIAMRFGLGGSAAYAMVGVGIWASMLGSGVDPLFSGLAIGLAAAAYPPRRDDLQRAAGRFKQFREEPTPQLARTAASSVHRSLSPNDRLQRAFHPWVSYVVVPLFALANAGISVDGSLLRNAMTSPITGGIVLAYVIGKPVAVLVTSLAIARITGGRVQPAVGWAAVTGSGTIAGIGFTVSFLVASHAFRGTELDEAKLGVLVSAIIAAVATWVVFRLTALLDEDRRVVVLHGGAEQLLDLAEEVDPHRDHVRGATDPLVTVVEYGDFQCPYCGRAEPAIRSVLSESDVQFVWRHLPLVDVHPEAELAAQAAEAAGDQGMFWEMHDLLLGHQDRLQEADVIAYADQLGLDSDRFLRQLRSGEHLVRIAQDVESADLSGVAGTPTFFINGRRHYGSFNASSLASDVQIARARNRARSR